MNGGLFHIIFAIPKIVTLRMIRFYQKSVSPDHGKLRMLFPYGYCRFYPTCSEYSYQAVERFGIIRGLLMACGRIFRCNPFNKGGYDPVPKRK